MQASTLVLALMLAGAARAEEAVAGSTSPAAPMVSAPAELAPAAALDTPTTVGERAEPAPIAVLPTAEIPPLPPLEVAIETAPEAVELLPVLGELPPISSPIEGTPAVGSTESQPETGVATAPAAPNVGADQAAGIAPKAPDVAIGVASAQPAMPDVAAGVAPSLPDAPPAAAVARVDLAGLGRALELALATPRGAIARLSETERGALAGFYRERNWAALFVDDNGLTASARRGAERMMKAAYDGLEPRTYVLALPQDATDGDTLARTELELVGTLMRYARDASQGRIDPQRISASITVERRPLAPAEVLTRLATGGDIATVIDGFNPPHPGFLALKRRLAEALDGAVDMAEKPRADAPVAIPPGPALKVGARDTRVALLRSRLGLVDSGTVSDAEVFDADVAQALKAFQRDNGLNPTGTLGPQTIERLNAGLDPATTASVGADRALIGDLVANMERWRWLPRELGRQHVFVNVADFSLVIRRDGQIAHRAKTIVGKVAPERQTPIFSQNMDHIVVNPYWNVPPNIVKKEMMSKIVSTGGGSVASGAWEVYVGNRQVDPRSVDWASTSPNAVSIRQKPGPSNALGNIKFMFPNTHSVYIHDTSSRGLFAQDFRAMSHGCVRVHEPFEFANALLAEEPNVSGEGLRKMVGNGGERYIRLASPIPVHITYFTRFFDEGGNLVTRQDIYGHNARLKAALGL